VAEKEGPTAMLSLGALARGSVARSVAQAVLLRARLQVSPFASDVTTTPQNAVEEITDENRESLRRRLLYRSQQRGWLELDLVMGEWAGKNLETMSDEGLKEYSELLDEENPDLFKWFTGQLAAPESVKGNFAFRAIHEEVQRRMRVGNTLSMNTSGAEWVRGWNDKK